MRNTIRYLSIGALAAVAMNWAAPSRCDEIRLKSLGGCRIALEDEDNRVNPYDLGGNPAYLVRDYEFGWTRLDLGGADESGHLRRPFDPDGITTYYFAASGTRKLGDQHVITGNIKLGRLEQVQVYHSLEIDQYNDPFYMTDRTLGSFQHDGPSAVVNYGIRLHPKLSLGAGFEYGISSGLKDTYTRPEIVHTNFAGTVGATYDARPDWVMGVFARPMRTQNRTSFEKTDEGFDNILYRYYGDGIYDIYSVSSYSVREVFKGWEIGLQNYFIGERFKLGAEFKYGLAENEVTYGSTTQHVKGYWQSTAYDFALLGRYGFESVPLTLGISGRYLNDEGWAKRPEYDDVLLYENPVDLLSVGAGASYAIAPLKLLAAAEYIANMYDIEVRDYGAGTSQGADVVQNIGRLGLEYSLYDLHSIRLGAEVTDYLVDRWLKMPANMDRYKITGGARYRTGYWNVDFHAEYGIGTKNSSAAERKSYAGVIAFVRLFN